VYPTIVVVHRDTAAAIAWSDGVFAGDGDLVGRARMAAQAEYLTPHAPVACGDTTPAAAAAAMLDACRGRGKLLTPTTAIAGWPTHVDPDAAYSPGAAHGGGHATRDEAQARTKARDRARHAASAARTRAGLTADRQLAEPVAPAPSAPPIEQVAAAVARARHRVVASRLWVVPDRHGWDEPTEAGGDVEAAVREAGTLLAARADCWAVERVAEAEAQLKARFNVSSRDEHLARLRSDYDEGQRQMKTILAQVDPDPQAKDLAIERTRITSRALFAAEHDEDEWSKALVLARAAAYLDALKEHRRFGMPDDELTVWRSDAGAKKKLGKVIEFHPVAWLIKHNGAARADNLDRDNHSPRALWVVGDDVPRGAYSHTLGVTYTWEDDDGTEGSRELVLDKLEISDVPRGALGPGESTALHEFGHRMEHLNPKITQIERVFLARRTRNPDGTHAPPEGYLHEDQPASQFEDLNWEKEWTRPDHFADSYIGRMYRRNLFREVFSTGMEGLFSGAHGALVGRDGYRADQEHRDLTLGILAAV
jgi:hypothetical protein